MEGEKMSTYFENQLRGYNVVIAVLRAYSKDICRNCIGLDGSKIKVIKGLKKLKMDLEGYDIPDVEKKKILVSIERFSDIAEKIDVAEETSCQKTAGNCKFGQPCLTLDGALGLFKQIPEPKTLTSSKVVNVTGACCYDTLTTPIKNMIKEMKPNQVLEVITAPGLKDMFKKFVEKEGYSILEEREKKEEISFKIRIVK